MPETFCKSSLIWLSISWVFSRDDVISPMSRIILKEISGIEEICPGALPLGETVKKIDAKRQKLIRTLIDGLDDLRKSLLCEPICLRDDCYCPITMLGSLIGKQHRLGILDTPPVAPYNGHSISSFIAEIVKPMLTQNQMRHMTTSSGICSCTIKWRLEDLFEKIETDISNYRLE
ncbi:hypothetical protein FVEN_g9179 [Fusarium venenatum]|uniref:Uncharacterized protein n=2 Tax=Fusarium venenatum TaxID=56646 RepID=A0A2L2T090_9HYPO|nr:uncharacterized protein FVRRES_00394 [Fusarium venenatum]KAG8352832.1 hypothetical protein FVEN_g9179 [Fusarium venenatum]CEI63882.1 unnamed protein product [Fusarium venenatum]